MAWEQLLSIRREAKQPYRRPQACPHDGQPYTADSDGAQVCPFDGYRPSGPKPRKQLYVHPGRRISAG